MPKADSICREVQADHLTGIAQRYPVKGGAYRTKGKPCLSLEKLAFWQPFLKLCTQLAVCAAWVFPEWERSEEGQEETFPSSPMATVCRVA